jgi:hypothetical protein
MAKHKIEDIFVSVVLVASRHKNENVDVIKQLSNLLRKRYSNYEIICVTEDSELVTSKQLGTALESMPCIRVVQLSKRDSTDLMIFAGIDSAIGDTVVVMLAGKDPVDKLPEFVEKNKEYSIVFGISDSRTRKGIVNEYGSRLFYWYNKKFLGIYIPNRSTYYAAFNRMAVNALTHNGRHAKHVRHLARQVGYENTSLIYTPSTDYGEKRKVKDLFISAIELSTNYSNHPLRFISWLGFLAALLNVGYAMYVVFVKVFKEEVAEGWTTTSLQLSVMFFFLFAILAILSEYIGKILQESRKEQPYHVVNELNSKISVADATRRKYREIMKKYDSSYLTHVSKKWGIPNL